MRSMAHALDLDDLYITPHSMRRGKATELFRTTNSFDAVAQAGRWEHNRTCREYVDAAVAETSRFSRVDTERLKRARLPLDIPFSG